MTQSNPLPPLKTLGPFLRVLAALATTDALAVTVDSSLANVYGYYADIGLRQSPSVVQCAALAIMERLLHAGYTESLRDLGRLVDLAEAAVLGGVHWEVTAHLVLLTRTLLEVAPSDPVFDIAQTLLVVQGGRFLRLFTLCNLSTFITDEKPEMCAQFFETFFAVSTSDRALLLGGNVEDIQAPSLEAAECYGFPSLHSWDITSAVNSVVDILLSRRAPLKDVLHVLDAILQTSTQNADMHSFWMSFIVRTQDDFSKALAIRGHAPGLVDAETKERCYHIAQKLFIDLSGISTKSEDPAMLQKKVIDWYRAVLQQSM